LFSRSWNDEAMAAKKAVLAMMKTAARTAVPSLAIAVFSASRRRILSCSVAT
jgi:hypothetical protein